MELVDQVAIFAWLLIGVTLLVITLPIWLLPYTGYMLYLRYKHMRKHGETQ